MPTNFDLMLQLLFQLAVLLSACRVGGWIFRRLGQPQVVAEMIVGIALGPSILGLIAPSVQVALFPTILSVSADTSLEIRHPSMFILYALSQLGLVLYMLVIGLQLDTRLLARHARQAASISIAGYLATPRTGLRHVAAVGGEALRYLS